MEMKSDNCYFADKRNFYQVSTYLQKLTFNEKNPEKQAKIQDSFEIPKRSPWIFLFI